ncbi:superoxide dismutase, Ni [Paraphotobacterium marinum]|uniref:Superoxide dismutase, Ni n=1 Tax=Paraphotobacterium marinum TaxID=1755811 RepID=A0A220VGS7_9GAMM|nr:superoxide dismutase, Ni [Paraphotobacterium marinum]ASK79618.1 superoxide dismutase, Ni [Paraphotobacterium marinum]
MFGKFIRSKLDVMNVPQLKAHCDIPCKIYDPHHAQVAVLTMIRMIDLIQELNGKDSLNITEQTRLIRFVSQKEEHGVILKNEIRVIWGDYFKTPQFEKFPEIHELTHSIMLLTSKVKQEINRDDALELLKKVNRFSEIFWLTKGVKVYEAVSPYPPSENVVYPDLKK